MSPRKACDSVNCLEEYEGEDLADTRVRLQPIERVGIMVLGGLDERECDVAQESILVADEGEIDCDTFWDHRIGTTLGDPVAVGLAAQK